LHSYSIRKCYRAEERAAKSTAVGDPLWANQGNGYLLKAQKKAFTIVTNILKSISDCPVIGRADVKRMQDILRPYLDTMAECFAPKKGSRPVNGEQKFARSHSAVAPRAMNEHLREHARCSLPEGKIGDSSSNHIQTGEAQ